MYKKKKILLPFYFAIIVIYFQQFNLNNQKDTKYLLFYLFLMSKKQSKEKYNGVYCLISLIVILSLEPYYMSTVINRLINKNSISPFHLIKWFLQTRSTVKRNI
jgi:hypothetical protein